MAFTATIPVSLGAAYAGIAAATLRLRLYNAAGTLLGEVAGNHASVTWVEAGGGDYTLTYTAFPDGAVTEVRLHNGGAGTANYLAHSLVDPGGVGSSGGGVTIQGDSIHVHDA